MLMKKNRFLYGVLLIVLAIMGVVISRPYVIVRNATAGKIYILSDENVIGIEPEPEEVEIIMKRKPEVIEPGGIIRLTPSFKYLWRKNLMLNIGWAVGGRYAYNSSGSGGINVILSNTKGSCSLHLIIRQGYNNYVMQSEDGIFCLKKLIHVNYIY
ncbi:hypothetical protein YA38_23605 [Klebsiella aerogenes]|nr:hypothetical protein YA38_23605 [Klebsiella aerogenes]